jgi:hypothetical protein
MNRKIIAVSFLIIGLSGCKSKQALDYSEKIVAMEQSLLPEIRRTEQKASEFFTTLQYDSAAAVSLRMEKIIDEKIKKIQTLEPPHVPGADNFKKASVKYFSYLKSIYTGYREFAIQTDDVEREIKRQRVLRTGDEKQDAVDEMQRAQRKFAKENNFRIKDK